MLLRHMHMDAFTEVTFMLELVVLSLNVYEYIGPIHIDFIIGQSYRCGS